MSSIMKYLSGTDNTPPAKRKPRYRVQYTDPSGKRRTKTGFVTKKAAEHWAAENLLERNTGSYIDPTRGNRTVGKVGAAWLESQTHLKPSTFTLAESTWRVHVLPRWGEVRVSEVTAGDVEQWAHGIEAGTATKRRAVAQLKQVMDRAVRDKLLYSNPVGAVKLPAKPPARRVYLSWGQLQTLAGNSAHPDIVLTLGTVGLRWGELAGLRVMDVDVKRRRLHIRQNAVRVRGRIVLGTPKTHEARTVAVSHRVLDLIAPQLEGKAPAELVWAQGDGTALKPPGHGKWLDTAVKRCQADDATFPRVTAHGLRHVAAGIMVNEMKATPKTVQRQLGHASAAMTLDTYSDLFDGALDEIADAFDGL
ncbi:MAG: tyrosine-type recombinase/integrase [Corynebacterium sp.]|uniref:tyrosine-type recombinase/integrase n=2 Tax=unclassified Corynebacterium TaxID=2624378 RepID=UPI003F926B63